MAEITEEIVAKAHQAYMGTVRYRGMDTSGPMRAALAAVDGELRALYACQGTHLEGQAELARQRLEFAATTSPASPRMPTDAYHLAAAQVHATLALVGEVAQLRAVLDPDDGVIDAEVHCAGCACPPVGCPRCGSDDWSAGLHLLGEDCTPAPEGA